MTDKRYRWKPHHIEFIKQHQADITRKELCELLKANFDDLPDTINRNNLQLFINRRLKLKSSNDRKLKKGIKPWNSGKSGYATKRRAKIGDESVSAKGYKLIKTKDDRHGWEFKHIVVWERANGKVPDGYCLKFIDNNKDNCELDNLMLIPKSVMPRLNRDNPADTDNPDLNKAIILTETLRHEIRKLHG